MAEDLDEAIERLIATCPCDACDRYRKSLAARAAHWAVRIEQLLKAKVDP